MSAALGTRGLRPVAELGRDRPHGDRLRYLSGCKCGLCRAGNSAYETYRAKLRRLGLGNGVVDAGPARAKLGELAQHGITLTAIAAAAGLRRQSLAAILAGDQPRIRAETGRRILALTAPDDLLL